MANRPMKKRKNTFDRMIEEFGKDGIDSIRADKMQRYAMSLIKDIAYGTIRYEEQGEFFLNEMIVNALDYVLTIKLQHYSSIKIAMDSYITSQNYTRLQPMEQKNMTIAWNKTNEIYQILITVYNAVRMAKINMGDVTELYNVPVRIQNYRSSINDI